MQVFAVLSVLPHRNQLKCFKMKKTIIKFGLLLLAVVLPTGCSSDDDEITLNAEDFIETISDMGTIRYSKDYHNNPSEHRWYIRCSPKMEDYIDGGTCYFPTSLPKQFRKEGLKVKFEGDIYPFESKYGGNVASGAFDLGLKFYFIELKNIESNE